MPKSQPLSHEIQLRLINFATALKDIADSFWKLVDQYSRAEAQIYSELLFVLARIGTDAHLIEFYKLLCDSDPVDEITLRTIVSLRTLLQPAQEEPV